MKVKGKVCVVTGAAGGIGEAIARRYAKESAKGLVVADRDAERLDKVAKDIGALAVAGDIGQESAVKRLVAEAEGVGSDMDPPGVQAARTGASASAPTARVIAMIGLRIGPPLSELGCAQAMTLVCEMAEREMTGRVSPSRGSPR